MRSHLRLLLLFFAAILIAAGICATFIFTISEEEHVNLKGSVILRDTYILSTCELPNGKFCIWTYDFESKDFKVRAYRDHLLELLDGSTSSCIVWAEYSDSPGSAPLGDADYYVLAKGETEAKPINLDVIREYAEEIGDLDFFLFQAHNSPTKIFVAFSSADETWPRPLAIFDIQTGKEHGRIPEVRTFFPGICFVGPNQEYLAVGDVDLSGLTRIRLFDANTFSELGHTTDEMGMYGSGLTTSSTDEFVVQVTSFDFVVCRVTSDSEHPAIIVDKEISYPEQPWKNSAIVGIKNSAGQILAGEVSPRWFSKYRDVRGSYYRKGIIDWESVRPPLLRIARVDDPNTVTDYPLGNPGEHDWPFQFSSDGTLVVTRSAPDSFQILRVALPKISVEQECRLKYDGTTDTLTLERLKPQ